MQKPRCRLVSSIIFSLKMSVRLNVGSQSKMQEILNLLSTSCEDFGLTLSTKKTEVMYQPTCAVPYMEFTTTVSGEKLALVYTFTFLSSTLS